MRRIFSKLPPESAIDPSLLETMFHHPYGHIQARRLYLREASESFRECNIQPVLL